MVILNPTLPPTPSLAKRGGEGGEFNMIATNVFKWNLLFYHSHCQKSTRRYFPGIWKSITTRGSS
ncbi:MAG: hypothetical protein D6732_02750 [Methanobacteriota archaeon]|nr:MAG: hypothetical protein D6732_02750 [Euryarchaeota archaeon]